MSLDEHDQTTPRRAESRGAGPRAPPAWRQDSRRQAPGRRQVWRQGRKEAGRADRSPPRPGSRSLAALVVLLLIAGGVYYYLSTKDPGGHRRRLHGWALDHRVAADFRLPRWRLLVTDNQRVKAGDVLVRIDDRDYVAARGQARAALEAAQAQKRSAQFGSAIARKNFPAKLLQAQGQLQQAQGQLFQGADRLQAAARRGAGGDPPSRAWTNRPRSSSWRRAR